MNSDLLRQVLLARLAGGSGGVSTTDVLTQVLQGDPRFAAVAQVMQAGAVANVASDAEADADVQDGQDTLSDAPDAPAVEAAMREVLDECERLRARSARLAAALGACHLCWGEDASCSYCSGTGSVGTFLIDRAAFDAEIGPALDQLNNRYRRFPNTQ